MFYHKHTQFYYPSKFEHLAHATYRDHTNYQVQIQESVIAKMNQDTMLSELNNFSDQIMMDISKGTKPKHFDMVYGIIRRCNNEISYEMLPVLNEVFLQLQRWIGSVAREAKRGPDYQNLGAIRNSLKMALYLGLYGIHTAIKTTKWMEVNTIKLDQGLNLPRGNKLFRMKSAAQNDTKQFHQKKWNLINITIRVFKELDLVKLWNYEIMEPCFFETFFMSGLQLIQNGIVRDITTRDLIIKDLFRYLFTMKPAILPFAKKNVIHALMDNEQHCTFISQFFSECPPDDSFAQAVIQDTVLFINLGSNLDEKELKKLKNMAVFLNKVAAQFVMFFLDKFSIFLNLYSCHCHQIRNFVNNIIAIIIQKVDITEQEKERYISLLAKRVYDKNPFCRSWTLDTLQTLINNKKLKLSNHTFREIYETAMDRMSDSSTNARKKAINLINEAIKIFLQRHGDMFGKSHQGFTTIEEVLREIEVSRTNVQSMDIEMRNISHNITIEQNEGDIQFSQFNLKMFEDKRWRCAKHLQICQLYLIILNTLQKNLDVMKILMNSQSSDLPNLIQLITLLKIKGIENIDSVLQQVWKRAYGEEESITNLIVDCFIKIYKKEGTFNEDHLISLFTNATATQLISFQNIIKIIMVNQNQTYQCKFDTYFVKKLWTKFIDAGRNSNNTQDPEKLAVIELMKTIFLNKPSLIKTQYIIYGIDYLYSISEGNTPNLDPDAIRFYFSFIQYAHQLLGEQIRQNFFCMAVLFLMDDQKLPIHTWCDMLKTLISIGFTCCDEPEELLQQIHTKLEEILQNQENQVAARGISTNNASLMNMKLDFFIGEMIIRLYDIQTQVSNQTQQAVTIGINSVKQQSNIEIAQTNNQHWRNQLLDMQLSDIRGVEYQGGEIIQEMEEFTKSILDCFAPWVQQIVEQVQKIIKKGSDGTYSQRIAAINFGKLMMCSFEFAKKHSKLLRFLMTKCLDETIRVNAIVAYTDALTKNASAVSLQVEGLLECLLDSNQIIQITALNAVWRLIEADAILIDCHFTYIALVFESEHTAIKDTCKRFLLKQSKTLKNFILYKLPETVSELSGENRNMFGNHRINPNSFACFANEMKYEIDQIRDNDAVQIILKSLITILLRSVNPLTISNVCLAISLLYHSDRSLIQLIECYSLAGPKLKQSPLSSQYFEKMITKMRRGANKKQGPKRSNFKNLVDEVEAKFVRHDINAVFGARFVQKQKKGVGVKKQRQQKARREPKKKNNAMKVEDSQSEEEVIEEVDMMENNAVNRPVASDDVTTKRVTRNKRNVVIIDSESDEEYDD